MFSSASNFSLQATDLKYAEYIEILVQIIFAKFTNKRTMGILGAQKLKITLKKNS